MSAEPVARVRVPPSARADLEAGALAALPAEACGTLLGMRAGEAIEIVSARSGRNLALSSSRFDLDPAEIVAAERDALERGLELVGIWHSHPDGQLQLSPSDREHAWGGWISLVVALRRDARPELRAWRLDARAGFVELPLE